MAAPAWRERIRIPTGTKVYFILLLIQHLKKHPVDNRKLRPSAAFPREEITYFDAVFYDSKAEQH